MRLTHCLTLLAFAAAVPAMYADAIPYPNVGTIAPTVTTYATTSGGIDIYFYGSTASFEDYVQVYDVNTGYESGDLLDNHNTALGAEFTAGTGAGQINAGDQLIFYIDSPQGLFGSAPGYSADGVNHAYITGYSGGVLNGVTIPAGLFVGLEDETQSDSDFNYNDDTFVFTGVSSPQVPSTTPEPSSLALLGTGALSLAGFARRKFRRS